ncbi:hypothetical protein [Limnohabitans parvus]|nr:hypothetical protein [Limnohabitans parvus]
MTAANNTMQQNPSADLRNNLNQSSSLLGALDAVTQWRPFAVLVMTFLACVVVNATFAAIFASMVMSGMAGFLFMLAILMTFGIALVGINAAGILVSDGVWGRPQRNITDALLTSLFTSHRLLLVLLFEGILFLAYLLVLGVLLLICKIPGVGPLLFAIVYPVAALLTGLVLFGLLYVAIPLAAPAIWSGSTAISALVMLKEIARHRLIMAVVMSLMLGLLMVVVSGIVVGIVGSGVGITLSMSAGIFGMSMNFDGLMGLMGGSGGNSGYMWALGLGSTILFLVAAIPVFLVGMKGAAIIHHTAIAGLSLREAEDKVNQQLQAAKERAQEIKTQVAAQAAAAQQATPKEAPAGLTCPSCSMTVTDADLFCGGCGHKLK